MSEHGTAYTQFMEVLAAVSKAVATIIDDFQISELIKHISRKGEKLTQYLRLVFTAIITDREIELSEIELSTKGKLLEPLGAVSVNTVKKFIARDYFKVGVYRGVCIDGLDDNFQKKFLPKVEENIFTTTLIFSRFKGDSNHDTSIIAEIGEKNYEITLAHMYELLKLQGRGQIGRLLTSGDANIFYIRDVDGKLWVVFATWQGGDGWHIKADSIDHEYGWPAGNQVFSR